MKKKVLNWILTIAVFFSLGSALNGCSTSENSANTMDEQTYLAQVTLAAEEFNKTLPKDEGVLELISYKFNPIKKELVLTHRFTTEDISTPTPELIANVRSAMIGMMSQNEGEMSYIEHGITFKFDYYTKDGGFIFSTSISPEDFNGVNALYPVASQN